MSNSSEDKRHLSMLAIPVLLSIVLGLSNDFITDAPRLIDDMSDSGIEESADDAKGRGEFQQVKDEYLPGHSEIAEANGTPTKKQLMKIAIESADYDAFLAAADGTPFVEVMTQDAFNVLVQEYKLRKSGYYTYIYQDLDDTSDT